MQKRNRKLPHLTKQTALWFGKPFMTSNHELERVLFLQLCSPHRATV